MGNRMLSSDAADEWAPDHKELQERMTKICGATRDLALNVKNEKRSWPILVLDTNERYASRVLSTQRVL